LVRGAWLLVLEHVAPDSGVDPISATLDVQMLAVTGGRERSAADLGRLLSQAGFGTREVLPTPGPITIVAAVPV
jgi:C-methyltransferase